MTMPISLPLTGGGGRSCYASLCSCQPGSHILTLSSSIITTIIQDSSFIFYHRDHHHQVGCPLYLPSLSSSTSTGIVNKRKGKGCVVAAEVNAIISIIIVTLINPILILILHIILIPILTIKVTAASLACDGSNYWNKCWRHAAGFVCNPPLR